MLCLMSQHSTPGALGHDPHKTGSLFAMALSCPVMAMCVLCGVLDPPPQQLREAQVGRCAALRCGVGWGGGGRAV